MSVFYGYPGRIWAVVLASLNHLTDTLSRTSNPFTVLPLAELVLDTALNGLSAININRISQIWQGEAITLSQLGIMPIALSPTDVAYFNNRLSATTAAGNAFAALVALPPLTGIAIALDQGIPSIADPGALEFYEEFLFETPPAGLTLNNLPTYAAQCATAFTDLASAVATVEGAGKDYKYDLASRFALEMSAFAGLLGGFSGFSGVSATTLWNQLFVLPTLLLHADLLSGAPNSLTAQQDQLLRYLILKAAQQVARFILTVSRPVAQKIEQATVLVGDSLMDIAARSLGDFEKWTALAQANNLSPPFLGATASPGIAAWGSKIQIPVSGGPPLTGVTPSYLFNFLGVDLYAGPINGDFPPWTGDFQLIAGYDNLRWALGRRMQTTLGKLIYHSDYGCRIPPEVGNVQTEDTADYITAFGEACLLSDPRVGSVLSAKTRLRPNFTVDFSGTVQPRGFGSTALEVNEVINSSIAPSAAVGG